jgi:hypothetical protein
MEHDCLLCIYAVDWVVDDNNTPNGVGDSTSVPIQALFAKRGHCASRFPRLPTPANGSPAASVARKASPEFAKQAGRPPSTKELRGTWWPTNGQRKGPGHQAPRGRGEHHYLRLPTSAGRGITKTKWNERLAWVKARCHGKRYYFLRKRQRTDPVRKSIAIRFHQFRINKVPLPIKRRFGKP